MSERGDGLRGHSKTISGDGRFGDDEFVIDAELLSQLLDLPASRVPELMRNREITSICERGVEDDEGKYRLTFFYRNRRARLSTDGIGRVVRRSAVNFGDRPIPGALRRVR